MVAWFSWFELKIGERTRRFSEPSLPLPAA
jgi:hypothetical protein